MGLSGRKDKQRIPADPRNLTWANDAAKFGSSYLSKFGWDPSKGLGATGDGRTSHIKVAQKLDMLGIGAAYQKDPSGTAWKQNRDFDNLLKRLNESATSERDNTPVGEEVTPTAVHEGSDEGRTKKRKRSKEGQDAPEENVKRKRKKDNLILNNAAEAEDPSPPKPYIPRHRAHRTRIIASKNIASKSASAISEILGISPTSASSAIQLGSTPFEKLTSLDEDLATEKISISTKSVVDYFKEKLLSKSSKSISTPSITTSEHEVEIDEEDPYDMPKQGLGSSRRPPESLDLETKRIGISKFSSLMSSSLLSVNPSPSPALEDDKKVKKTETSKDKQGIDEDHDTTTDGKQKRKKHKRDATDTYPSSLNGGLSDERRARDKEERKRARAEKKARKDKRV